MIKKLIIFALLLTFNILSAQNKGYSIIGKWIATDEKKITGGIEFISNGKARLLMLGKEMPQCDYKIDYEKDPISIKLITKQNGETRIMYSLIKFIDKETIKWEIFPAAEKQPTEFSNNSVHTSVILIKSKKNLFYV